MASSKLGLSSSSTPYKSKNKLQRSQQHLKVKKARESVKRDQRFRRKREEDKDPTLREERRAKNVPLTIDRKRVWDEVEGQEGDGLGLSVDVERLKRRKVEEDEERAQKPPIEALRHLEDSDSRVIENGGREEGEDPEDDKDSMLASDAESSEDEHLDDAPNNKLKPTKTPRERATSPTHSTTSTNFALTPEALSARFPTIFQPQAAPKLLITTSQNASIPLHDAASAFVRLYPNSTYVPRKAHARAYKYSLKEICTFASNRGFSAVLVVNSDLQGKKPTGLTVVHLPSGPTFTFSILTFVHGSALPGHGNPTAHIPELILNNFRTPLGHLTASLFRTLLPTQPDIEGRQVLTLHNQRDYIFLRRHRYVFRDKRGNEKNVVGSDGKEMIGVKGIRAGLQELGPRMSLKLRRIDEGVGRTSKPVWRWEAGKEKVRTRFEL